MENLNKRSKFSPDFDRDDPFNFENEDSEPTGRPIGQNQQIVKSAQIYHVTISNVKKLHVMTIVLGMDQIILSSIINS